MNRYDVYHQDNRDSAEMYDYLESRITVLKQRIFDLEMENVTLRCQMEDSRNEVVASDSQTVGGYIHTVLTMAN